MKHLVARLLSLVLVMAVIATTAPCRCSNHDVITNVCTPACYANHAQNNGACTPSIQPRNILDASPHG